MNVAVRLLCIELPGGNQQFDIAAPEGATVAQALAILARERDIGALDADTLVKSSLFLNKMFTTADAHLREGDSLTVVRTLAGG